MPELRDLLAAATRRLAGDAPRLEAELLLAHAFGKPRAWLYAHGTDVVTAAEGAAFAALVQRRVDGEPIAYLIGRREFWNLDLAVTTATLIPRPETELLVELALARIPTDRSVTIADLGTGSGAIALAIARERPLAQVWATDASAQALAVARGNAGRAGLRNLRFEQGDWCAALGEQQFDAIVSNPPYIAEGDPHLSQGDLRFEPSQALASGHDGLNAIRQIVREAAKCLKPDAFLLFEHGYDQALAVRDLLAQAGYADPFTVADLEQRDRVSGAGAPGGKV